MRTVSSPLLVAPAGTGTESRILSILPQLPSCPPEARNPAPIHSEPALTDETYSLLPEKSVFATSMVSRTGGPDLTPEKETSQKGAADRVSEHTSLSSFGSV